MFLNFHGVWLILVTSWHESAMKFLCKSSCDHSLSIACKILAKLTWMQNSLLKLLLYVSCVPLCGSFSACPPLCTPSPPLLFRRWSFQHLSLNSTRRTIPPPKKLCWESSNNAHCCPSGNMSGRRDINRLTTSSGTTAPSLTRYRVLQHCIAMYCIV